MAIYLVSYQTLFIPGGKKLSSYCFVFPPELSSSGRVNCLYSLQLGSTPLLIFWSIMFSNVFHTWNACFNASFPLDYEIIHEANEAQPYCSADRVNSVSCVGFNKCPLWFSDFAIPIVLSVRMGAGLIGSFPLLTLSFEGKPGATSYTPVSLKFNSPNIC